MGRDLGCRSGTWVHCVLHWLGLFAVAVHAELRIRAYEERVGEDSGSFDETFWTKLDGVANALDNVQDESNYFYPADYYTC